MNARRPLTLVMPFYKNLGMWQEHQRVWQQYPAWLKAQLHVIVVDDCSPKGYRPSQKSVLSTGIASVRLYRLLKKQRWNWLACRNLGASQTSTEWVLFTDIDHVLPWQTMAWIVQSDLQPENAYRFGRRDAPHVWPYALEECRPYKSHPDTWLMTRDRFLSWPGIGGYDERLSGCYGTSGEFRDRVFRSTRAHLFRDHVVMIRYPREIIPDASTSPDEYTRKGDAENDEELRRRREARALIPDWRPLHGLVGHELVYSSLETGVLC